MAKIVVAAIFLKKPYGMEEMTKIDEVLNQLGDKVESTRKGRFWEVVKDNHLYNVDVRKTEGKIHDIEDELLNLNLLPEDAPETISIVSSVGGEQDLLFVSAVSEKINSNLNGVSSGAKYNS